MKTFDDLEVHRPVLARSYLELLKAQPGRPIALFAPRRVGKTFFLDQDLTPAARAAGFTPVYADIWLHRISPLSAINHAFEESLDDATVPASAVGKTAKTPVKKVGALGAALEFGEEPKHRALPSEPALRLDTLRLVQHQEHWLAASRRQASDTYVTQERVAPGGMGFPGAVASLAGRRAPPAPYSYRSDPRVPPFPDDRPIFIFDALATGRYAMGFLWCAKLLNPEFMDILDL